MEKNRWSLVWISILALFFTMISPGPTPIDVFAFSPNHEKFSTLNATTAYPLHPGYPISVGYWIEKAPVTIADINNDGNNEILLPTWNSGSTNPGKVYSWNVQGNLLPGFPINTYGNVRGRIALGDLDHNGDYEIVAGVESVSMGVGPTIFVYRPDGSVYPGWPQTTACARFDHYCTTASIVLADLDKDDNLEIIVATTNRDLTSSDPALYVPNLYVFRSDGSLAPGSWPNEDDHNTAIIGQIAVGDLDGDSYLDIVTGRDYNRLFAFNRFGAPLNDNWPHYTWWPYDENDWEDDQIEYPRSSPVLADLDSDGYLEYIVPGQRRYAENATYYASDLLIYTDSANRWPSWELPASGSSLIGSTTVRMIEAPAIADLTGDGKPEIILATQDGFVRAYTANKQVLWAFDYAQGKNIHTSETVVGDVDGDGWNDVVFGTFDVDLGNEGPVGVYILNHNGVPKTETPLWVKSPGISASPALGDLDNDGLIEIATSTYSGDIYVWDAPGLALPQRLPWPMSRHDLQRTGQYVDVMPNFSKTEITVSNLTPKSGETLTFTIRVIQSGAPLDEIIHVMNTLPSGLTYQSSSLRATSGTVDDGAAPTLRWSGKLMTISEVIITFRATVDTQITSAYKNTAVIYAGTAGNFERSVTIFVNGKVNFLPLLGR